MIGSWPVYMNVHALRYCLHCQLGDLLVGATPQQSSVPWSVCAGCGEVGCRSDGYRWLHFLLAWRFLGTNCCAFGCEPMRRLLMLFYLGFPLPLYVAHIPLKNFKVLKALGGENSLLLLGFWLSSLGYLLYNGSWTVAVGDRWLLTCLAISWYNCAFGYEPMRRLLM